MISYNQIHEEITRLVNAIKTGGSGNGGSGSSVEVIQKIDYGDNIADISVDENTVNLFNGHLYSESEKVVGEWIDGRKVYEKVINLENVAWSQEIVIQENVDIIVEENLYYSDSTLQNGSFFPCKGFPQVSYWYYTHLTYLKNDNNLIFRLDKCDGNLTIKGVIKYVKKNE